MRKIEKEVLEDAVGIMACSMALKGKAKICPKCRFKSVCVSIRKRIRMTVESMEKAGRKVREVDGGK